MADYRFRLFYPTLKSRVKRTLPLITPRKGDPAFFARRLNFTDGSTVVYRTVNPHPHKIIERDILTSHIWNSKISKPKFNVETDYSRFRKLHGSEADYEHVVNLFSNKE